MENYYNELIKKVETGQPLNKKEIRNIRVALKMNDAFDEVLNVELGLSEAVTIEKQIRDTVTISVNEYANLENRSEWLSCLEQAGVDNWEGYSYARDLLHEGDED
jgi:hypothetical protein